MNALSKPKHCGQDWLEMTPTGGGRICGQCSKVIVDFSKKSWADIENIQAQSNNSVCGMYTDKQLEHWGREVPAGNCSKIATTTALFLSLTTSIPAIGQIINKDSTSRTIIRGTITGKSPSLKIDTLDYATVTLKGTAIGVVADDNGAYSLDITDYIDTVHTPTLVYTALGYDEYELILDSKGELKKDIELTEFDTRIITYSVSKPTWIQRLKRNIRRIFT